MRRLLLSIVPFAALTGCVAAVVPVLAGGAMVRSTTAGKAKPQPRASVEPPQPAPGPTPASTPATPPPAFDPAREVRAGEIYQGKLPPPGPAPASTEPPVRAEPAAALTVSSWADVGHHVAADLSPEHAMLLARGSSPEQPRWVGCAGKPLAVLAAASTVLAPATRRVAPEAESWAGALRVLSVAMVVVAGDQAEADAITTAFVGAKLPALVDGDTLRVSAPDRMPATRADIGARYCVLAVAGRAAADFPNALTPATTPAPLQALWGRGWFLLPGAD